MKTTETMLVRGTSPSFSDDCVMSDNTLTATLPIGAVKKSHSEIKKETLFDNKLNNLYDIGNYSNENYKRGRNTLAFWIIITILLILCIGNLILTITIMGVLKLGKGMHGIELIPEENAIKFFGSTDLDRVYRKTNGLIEGFADIPVTITSENDNGVYIRLHRNGGWSNRILMDKMGTQFRYVNSFELKDPLKGNTIFTTHRPHYNMPSGANALKTKIMSATRIQSPIGEPLALTADGKVSIKGSEGIYIDSANALFQAEHNININSTQGGTYLAASSGIYLDLDKVPVASTEFGLRTGNFQYKLCVCMPQGIVFRIPVPRVHNAPKVSCVHFTSKQDPCSLN